MGFVIGVLFLPSIHPSIHLCDSSETIDSFTVAKATTTLSPVLHSSLRERERGGGGDGCGGGTVGGGELKGIPWWWSCNVHLLRRTQICLPHFISRFEGFRE